MTRNPDKRSATARKDKKNIVDEDEVEENKTDVKKKENDKETGISKENQVDDDDRKGDSKNRSVHSEDKSQDKDKSKDKDYGKNIADKRDDEDRNKDKSKENSDVKAQPSTSNAKKKDGNDPGIDRTRDSQKELPTDGDLGDVDPDTGSGGFKLMIDSLLENLKIVISGSQTLDSSNFHELCEIDKATCELPAIVTSMPAELSFEEDSSGEWCLQKGRIRSPKSSWTDYESFLKVYRHIVEGGVKEMYRIFKIEGTCYEHQTQIVNPEDIGFDKDPRNMITREARNVVYNNVPVFAVLPQVRFSDSIPIVMNPVLSDLTLETQRFLVEAEQDNANLRVWIATFIRRKDQFMQFGLQTVYGRNNVFWARCPHPRYVGLWLNAFPNANRISIPYALKFTGPRVVTRAVKLTTVSAALQTSVVNASILTKLGTDPLSASNKMDIENIMKALILPGQIQLEIEYDITDADELMAVAALSAKTLFSTSPNTRNITRASAEASDRVIARWLASCGYEDSPNANIPLHMRRRKTRALSLFDTLTTNFGDGAGWCNTGSVERVPIPDPLYEGVAYMHQVAGVTPSRTVMDYHTLGNAEPPQIINRVKNALGEGAIDNSKCIGPVMRWFNSLVPQYMQFVGCLNRYLLTFGETGFRLSDRRLIEMMTADNAQDGLNPAYNTPVIIPVKYDSIYKFFRALPESIDPPTSLPQQVNAESLISAEMQRFISAFMIMLDRLDRDGRADGFVSKLVMRWAIESTESNHFAKKILDLCLSDGDASRVNVAVLRALVARFDEFEAVYFPRYARIVDVNPEYFGFTFDVIKRRTDLPTLSEAMYNERRAVGIILENAMVVPLAYPRRQLTWDQMNTYLRSYTLITEMRRLDILTSLPLPIRYSESTVQAMVDDDPPPFVVGNVNSDDVHVVDRETITVNSFQRKFLLPKADSVFRPDQVFYGSDFIQYWTTTNRTLISALNPQELVARWMCTRVRNWKKYVVFENPLKLRGAGDPA